MKVYFLRHGQTRVNTIRAVHAKQDEAVLDETGNEQAHKLAQACQDLGVGQLFCSPEVRARQTAESIADRLKLQPIVLEDLGERDWGDWAGWPWKEIQARLEGMSLADRYQFTPPHGESWKQMEERLKRALVKITKADSPTAVVTHGGAMRALMPLLQEAPKETSFKYDFANASITGFEFTGGKWTEFQENDTAHLK